MKYKSVLIIVVIFFILISCAFLLIDWDKREAESHANSYPSVKAEGLVTEDTATKESVNTHEASIESSVFKKAEPNLADSKFQLSNFLARQGVNALAEGLIKEIKSGKVDANESLKKGDDSYNSLLAVLALDENLTPRQIEELISLGAEVQHSDTWIMMVSSTTSSNLQVLLDHGFDANSDFWGNKLINLALIYENYEVVDLLMERGFNIEREWVHEFPNGEGTMQSGTMDLKTFVVDGIDDKRSENIKKYLESKGITL